jgi:hypothetical protein
MSNDDALAKRGRALEDDYFRRRDQELIEKMREQWSAEKKEQAMGTAAGLNDPHLLQELLTLGFTPETVKLLPLVPLLQVAWAEGGVSPAERDLILKLAESRGLTAGSPADAQLMDWLANRPADQVFAGAGRLIHAMLESGAEPVANLNADALVEYAEKVAAASGGIFGLGRVSGEERALLASLAAGLKSKSSS